MGSLRLFFATFLDPKFLAFVGSGLIVSVAYIDPGNWGTNITGGADFNYNLLWVVWLASAMAMLFQYLSGKLGIVNYTLPELIRRALPTKPLRVGYWLMAEVAIIATDMAEFLGIVVALHLLFNIPLLAGAYFAVFDIFIVLLLTEKRFRTLEQAFIIFVSIIGIAYLYELFLTRPQIGLVVYHTFVPILTPASALVAVGIVGATVMPHALFVHSWLIKNKLLRLNFTDKAKALRFHLADNVLSLTIAGCINAAMIIMAASAFYKNGAGVATLGQAYETLTPLFGHLASLVFALALLAAGISSSITGVIAGQAIMEDLVDFRVSPWIRRIVTRVINLIPITIAIMLKIEPLRILVISQVILSLLLPFVIIPLVRFTSNKKIMGSYVNQKLTSGLAYLSTTLIIGMNLYLIYRTVIDLFFQRGS